MPSPTVGVIQGQLPPALPAELQACHWPEWELEDARKIWEHYEDFLSGHGYHITGSDTYNSLGKGGTNMPPSADPFRPNDNESFIRHSRHTQMLCNYQPCVEVCFGIDRCHRAVVFKAVMHESAELKILRLLNSPSFREDKRNRVIPVLQFLETHDFVIVVMPHWGMCWDMPPCGNMITRGEMAIKLVEGLAWLHEQGIAHGDIHPRNVVISHSDYRSLAGLPENDFRQTSKLEYAFIDLGSAHIFTPGEPHIGVPETAPPDLFSCPEQEETRPIDVFAADVYNLAKTLENEFDSALMKYGEEHLRRQKNHQEYRNLLCAMADLQPENRPTAASALATLCVIFQPDSESEEQEGGGSVPRGQE